MYKTYKLDNPTLIEIWKSINQQNHQQIIRQQVSQWLNNVLYNLQNLSFQNSNIQKLIQQYVKQQKVQVSNFKTVKFSQAVQILNWILMRQEIKQIQQQKVELNNHLQQFQNPIIEKVDANIKEQNEKIENKIEDQIIKSTKNNNQQRWKSYIEIIFQHYCKITYGFKSKSQSFEQLLLLHINMPMNKFLIFCREFRFLQLSNINSNILQDIFKKKASPQKLININSFLEIIQSISTTVFPQLTSQQSLSKIITYMEIDSFNSFMNKIKKLNIRYSNKKIQSLPKKKPQNYQFQYSPKYQQNIQKIKSEQKIKNKQNKSKTQLLKPRLNKVHSQKLVNQTPILQISKNSKPTLSLEIKNEGYLEIHMKMQKLNKVESRLKLNSVVQSAKKLIAQNQFLNYDYTNATQHKRTNSFILGKKKLLKLKQFKKPYQSQNISIFGKIDRDKQSIQYLTSLIQEQDNDQYLRMHLQRENRRNYLSKIIERKINKLIPD